MKENANNKNKTIISVFTLVIVMMLGFIMVPGEALAESSDVSAIADWDEYSASGCTDDAVTYNSDPSIHLDAGWGKEEFGDFTTATIDFYIYFDSTVDQDDKLILSIVDKDDAANNIEITIYPYSAENTAVKVKDTYKEQTYSRSDTERVDTSGHWQQVEIAITETDDKADGTKLHFDIDIGTMEYADIDFELYSAELKTTTKQRKWNYITFESKTDEAEINIDGIAINTSGVPLYGYNYTFIILLVLAVAVGAAWSFKIWPISSKGPLRKVSRK